MSKTRQPAQHRAKATRNLWHVSTSASPLTLHSQPSVRSPKRCIQRNTGFSKRVHPANVWDSVERAASLYQVYLHLFRAHRREIKQMGHSHCAIGATQATCMRNVGNLQVILRPNFSTRGRSNQQRLFLRNLFRRERCSTTFVWTVPPYTGATTQRMGR
jgi:hypothetical protein